jgi:hypothetical protein
MLEDFPALILAVALATSNLTTVPKSFVAVLQKESASPAFLVSVELDTRTLGKAGATSSGS